MGNSYVAGATTSLDFPLQDPIQSHFAGGFHSDGAVGDVFLARFNPAGSELGFSTYLGGAGLDYGSCCNVIAVDACADAYLTGSTSSSDFPLLDPLQPTYGEAGDAFVTKVLFDDITDLAIAKTDTPDLGCRNPP